VLNTVIELASITLQKTATQAVHDDLVSVFNSHIWKLGQTDRQRVETYRTMMAERQPLARVFTPRVFTPAPLSEDQQRTLADTLSALINKPVTLAIEVDPDLIAGLKVRLGDTIMDYTLQRQLSELRTDLKEELTRRLQV